MMQKYPISFSSAGTQLNRFINSKRTKLPMLVWCVLFFILLASGASGQIFGFNISGISWIVPLLFSVYVIATRLSLVTFPWKLWLPWVLLLIIHMLTLDYALLDFRVSPLQRTTQVLSPLAIGVAVSTYRPSQAMLEKFFSVLQLFAYLVIGLIAFTGRNMFLTPDFSGFAAQNMTVLLLCVFFANRYLLFREMRDLQLWFVLACIPVISVTRMVIAVTLLTFPLAFSPMSITRRLVFILLMMVAGLGIFQLPIVQEKMFFSGHGELSDIGHSDDFATSGRSAIWEVLYEEAQKELLTGHGTGAAETITYSFTPVGYPHNDWLLTFYDYGILGVVIYVLCLILTIWHGFRAQIASHHMATRLLMLAGVSAFIPFMIVMYTDNIMVYASFFGMLHYTFLGLGYGALKVEQDVKRVRMDS
ncbi:MAG: O-antigen ligase family protein [Gallionella sp.]|jgi:hypothetical protein